MPNLQSERLVQISKSNSLDKSPVTSAEILPKSLNLGERKRRVKEIEQDNLALGVRIYRVRPSIDFAQIDNDYKYNHEIKKRISKFPM